VPYTSHAIALTQIASVVSLPGI